MADSLGDVIINLRSRDVNMKAGLQGVQEELGHLSNKIFSAEGALHLAFGGAAGRAIFHEMHAALKDLGEGFAEGQAKGESFGDSLATGVLHVVKMKSALEEAAEAAKGLTQSYEDLMKADEKAAEFFKSADDNIMKGTKAFGDRTLDLDSDMPLLNNKEESKYNDAAKALDEQRHKLIFGDKELHEKSPTKNLGGLADQSQYLQVLKDIQRKKEAGTDSFGDAMFLAAGGIIGKSGLDKEVAAVQKRVNNLMGSIGMVEDRQKDLAKGGAEAEIKNTGTALKQGWKNIVDIGIDAWKPIGTMLSKTAEGFHKDGVKADKEAAKKSLEYKMKELDRFIESEMKKQEKTEEQEKHDDESAKHIRDATDPTAKLKDEFTEIARLVGIGKLTQEEADKARKKDVKEFNQANQRDNKIEFRSADAAADDMLKKSLEGAGLQKEANDLLKQINDKVGKTHGMVA